MKFQIAINLERMDASTDMNAVQKHTIEMVQMAEQKVAFIFSTAGNSCCVHLVGMV